jgi:hypothetical protein
MKKKVFCLALVMIIALACLDGTAWAAGVTASPARTKVFVNGVERNFEAYEISGNNYFKQRDLASALNGTGKQFELGYSDATGAITITTGQPYTPAGGEMAAGDGRAKAARPTASKMYVDGKEVNFSVYDIGGSNFIKLSALMSALDIAVTYNEATQSIRLDTTQAYTPEVSAATPAGVAAQPAFPAAPAGGMVATGSTVGKAKEGDIIRFGNYNWLVLEVTYNDSGTGTALIITENIVAEKHNELESYLYMKGEFLNKFTAAEQARIHGKDIFFLGWRYEYFDDDEDRLMKDSNGNTIDWWMSGSGLYSYVDSAGTTVYDFKPVLAEIPGDVYGGEYDGHYSTYQMSTYHPVKGTRPAMYVDADNHVIVGSTIPTWNGTVRDVHIGGTVQFNRYKWRVLDVQSDKALIIMESKVEARPYHEGDYWNDGKGVTWETCTLREYLNGRFFQSFSDANQACIVETLNDNPDNAKYKTPGGNATMDKIFLLSIDEANKYFKDNSDRLKHYSWWLRSPGEPYNANWSPVFSVNAAYVFRPNGADKSSGGVVYAGIAVARKDIMFVRPALWVKLKP